MSSNWTPVALSQDVLPGMAIPAHLQDQDLVVWRSATGRIAAWHDRCPHRGMRLSHGFVRGEFLSCIYHGWRYGEDGQCRKIPAHPELAPPAAIKVPRFAVCESAGVVWVAPEGETSEPVDLPGFRGFRSVAVNAAADQVARDVAGQGHLGGCDVVMLVQPLPGGDCGLHVLVADGCADAQLDALSHAIEALRRRLEQGVAA
ncbi:Rieske (2Fe-2S) protein [Paracoccus sp. 1_MG-2023]|uniref:Rieske (2Fe-2S) protein n=1 Tax=Paracoccus sp. 1_MG-2023 TaxID=3062651 RepID=UPI001C0881FF|nr:Rieske (2Fe-2S) protein [Paracoccus sp. 1_MG-2023]MBU2957973.1 Rieske (2Fe-2S) protein [Paracoccus sp. C2R09]MDO6668833.1 Rieske (2Fe-2S) protein [Paracoccus sp. 1_MG-2023]